MSDVLQVPDAEHPVQILPEADCWRLLGGMQLGRLGVSRGNEPDIFPINCWPQGDKVFLHGPQPVRTALSQAGPHVVLEADGREEATVWSVMATGTVRRLERPEDLELVRQLQPWTDAPDGVYLELRPEEITGRRIALGPEERY